MQENPPVQPMEEILASIRRIIAEDPPILAPKPVPAAEDEDVLELGEAPAAAARLFPPVPDDGLVSGEAAAASRKALSALSGVTIDPDAAADTLDGLVREMLRPMLKQWLDANLPELVERVVAREIARIGGR
ncbi:DUF2497 domain-containing protein [Sphingomonas bacterium]|uniref:DUF2497 domain-containing protein n=1 Tax=Sphingomonas bacterium TaxID=1895847 RepID=UPI0020C62E91|nr:DUF2497 domain-containing protein [Sphingomonas bacterium]